MTVRRYALKMIIYDVLNLCKKGQLVLVWYLYFKLPYTSMYWPSVRLFIMIFWIHKHIVSYLSISCQIPHNYRDNSCFHIARPYSVDSCSQAGACSCIEAAGAGRAGSLVWSSLKDLVGGGVKTGRYRLHLVCWWWMALLFNSLSGCQIPCQACPWTSWMYVEVISGKGCPFEKSELTPRI